MDILEQGFEACAAGLRDFGYSDVTAAQIQLAHSRWKKGEEPQGVVEMFAVKDFAERPEIFGTQEGAGHGTD